MHHAHLPETTAAQLLSAFLRFGRTPWHNAPADGISRSETNILVHIQRANRHERILRVSDLSATLRVSSSTITQHLNSLENQGFVERVQSQEDKRAVNLSLTPKGMEALKSHWVALERDFAQFVAEIGEEDAALLSDLLARAHAFFVQKSKVYENEDL